VRDFETITAAQEYLGVMRFRKPFHSVDHDLQEIVEGLCGSEDLAINFENDGKSVYNAPEFAV
jgi:hypothetical protein